MCFKAATLFLVPFLAQACDCYSPLSPCEVLKNRAEGEAVFVGRAHRITRAWARSLIEFEVVEAFHGVAKGNVTLEMSASNCDYRFQLGEEFLVIARRTMEPNGLYSTMCSRTGLAIQRHAEIEVLRAEKKGTILFGIIKGYRQRSKAMGGSYSEVVEGAIVKLSTGQTAKTSWFGDFTFVGLQGTEFELSVDAPGWRFTNPRKVELSGRCRDLEIFGESVQLLSPPLPE